MFPFLFVFFSPKHQHFKTRIPVCTTAAAACCSLPTSPADCRLRALPSRSLSPNPAGRLPSAGALRRSRTLSCSFWRWASARALSLTWSAASSLARSATSSLWCCCSCVHSARDAAIARKWLALGLRHGAHDARPCHAMCCAFGLA